MQISELSLTCDTDWQTLSALITWETVDRPAQRIHFRVPAGTVSLRRHVNPFLLAAVVPAMAAGESRIATKFPVDGALREGLASAMAILRLWCSDIAQGWSMPQLEAPSETLTVPANRATASFYSGGVDATFNILHNAALIAPGDRGRIAYAFLVYGLDLGFKESANDLPAFDEFVRSSSPALIAKGIRPVPIHTNLRHLDARSGFWGRAFNGFALSAIAQIAPDDIEQVMIGTSGERLSTNVQLPWGSHPVLHSYLCSSAVQSRSPYVEYSRLERVRAIASDEGARKSLRVCFSSKSGELNCGRCEKCVRTRVALMLSGSDPGLGFGGPELTPALLDSVAITSWVGHAEHQELRDGLLAAGLNDYVAVEERLLKRWEDYDKWVQKRGFKGWLRRLRDRAAAPRAA